MAFTPTMTAGNEGLEDKVPSLSKLESPERLSARRLAKRFTPARALGGRGSALKTESLSKVKIRKP